MSESNRFLEPITLEIDQVTVAPQRPHHVLHVVKGPSSGQVLQVEGSGAVVGRSEGVRLCIPDQSVSREHARFERTGDTMFVVDLGSRNGTLVNGKRIASRTELANGDLLTFGQVIVRFAIVATSELDTSRAIYEAAVKDPLTRLHNRGFFDDRFKVEFAYARRHAAPLAVLIIDLDHFKQINDRYGHPAGDAVLRATAEQIGRSVRTEDLAARYGGEEFVVLARGTDDDGARVLAQRLRTRISLVTVPTAQGVIRVTASIGIAVMRDDRRYENEGHLVAAADEGLYAAKRGGRDRAVLNPSVTQATEGSGHPSPAQPLT